VIVVIGSPDGWLRDAEVVPAGTPALAAMAAAAAGREVQLVGRTGDDAMADELLMSLTRAGVGHVAVLRDPTRPTGLVPEPEPEDAGPGSAGEAAIETLAPPAAPPLDAGDVDMGLRYLTSFGVVVLADAANREVVRVVADAASWNAARLVVVVDPQTEPSDALPPDAIVFEAPADDPDGAFAALVGRFAAALDDGTEPADAFRSTIEADGWTESPPD
jgi:sugar/nucleoside kinase (ribokinase family)